MVDLVPTVVLTRDGAEAIAHRIHVSNRMHITEGVLSRFFSALDALVLV